MTLRDHLERHHPELADLPRGVLLGALDIAPEPPADMPWQESLRLLRAQVDRERAS